MKTSRALIVLATMFLAGCGGGGSSGASAPVAPATQAPPDGALTSNGSNTAQLTIHFAAPGATTASTQRSPKFVSPSTTQITVTVNLVNGAAPPAWVTPNPQVTALAVGTNCTLSGGTETCTIPVMAPPGVVNYTFAVSDGTHTLATLTANETLAQGTNNSLSVTLQGIASTVAVTGASLAANSSIGSEVLTVNASDVDGNLIVAPGNYNNPITLTDNDLTGVTSLSVNGVGSSPSVVVTAPTDVVRLNYNGQAVNNFTITASGAGIAGTGTITSNVDDITFTGTTLDDAGHGGLNTDANFGQQTIFFATNTGTQSITGAELGFSNAPYSKTFTVDPGTIVSTTGGTCGTGPTAVAAVTGASPTFAITAQQVGVCSMRFKESGTGYPITQHAANVAGSPTHDGTFWVSVTAASIGINGEHRH
jgi:hypothetical protein